MKNKQLVKSECLAEIKVSYKAKVKASERPQITNSNDAERILRPLYDENNIERIEEAFVMVLNRGNKILGWTKIGIGGVAGVVMDVKVIMQIAILSNASGIILSHNHPSDNLKVSKQDIELTRKVKQAASYFDIEILDHIIMASEGYVSMADEGLI